MFVVLNPFCPFKCLFWFHIFVKRSFVKRSKTRLNLWNKIIRITIARSDFCFVSTKFRLLHVCFGLFLQPIVWNWLSCSLNVTCGSVKFGRSWMRNVNTCKFLCDIFWNSFNTWINTRKTLFGKIRSFVYSMSCLCDLFRPTNIVVRPPKNVD